MSEDHALVEKYWPQVTALHRMLEAIEAKSINVSAPPPAAAGGDGQAIVTAIKQFEISNGKAWRS